MHWNSSQAPGHALLIFFCLLVTFTYLILFHQNSYSLPSANTAVNLSVVLRRNSSRIPSSEHNLLPSNYSTLEKSVGAQYKILPKSCREFPVQPFLVLIAFSRATAFKLRQAIRKTWGSVASPVCGVRLLFMFGRVFDKTIQNRLYAEAKTYGDVIQSNQFDDIYRSASEKALHLLQWGAAFCPESVYTAKIDDDNWLNLPRYFKFLQKYQNTDYVWGAMVDQGTRVVRHTGTKYFVPREEYNGDLYPEYLSGILYAFPTRFIPRVLAASKGIPRTFNDDVYVCGILATRANLTRKPVPNYAWDQPSASRDSYCSKRDAMCIHYSSVEDLYEMWHDPCHRYDELC